MYANYLRNTLRNPDIHTHTQTHHQYIIKWHKQCQRELSNIVMRPVKNARVQEVDIFAAHRPIRIRDRSLLALMANWLGPGALIPRSFLSPSSGCNRSGGWNSPPPRHILEYQPPLFWTRTLFISKQRLIEEIPQKLILE